MSNEYFICGWHKLTESQKEKMRAYLKYLEEQDDEADQKDQENEPSR